MVGVVGVGEVVGAPEVGLRGGRSGAAQAGTGLGGCGSVADDRGWAAPQLAGSARRYEMLIPSDPACGSGSSRLRVAVVVGNGRSAGDSDIVEGQAAMDLRFPRAIRAVSSARLPWSM